MAKLERDLQCHCVGRLEVVRPKPVGFLCGSIPVPTDKSFHAFNSSALVPSSQTVSAPRYRMLPTETDLNTPPVLSNFPDKVLPPAAVQSEATGDLPWEGGAVTSNLSRKCEALAVSGLVEYGDEIDVIAPADILKQIFKMPYSKARLSIAVHRVGQTLVLNAGVLGENCRWAPFSFFYLFEDSRECQLSVTPLTWLEAWLDNVMASVPELAICYHQDGVVQGYELLKTDDIFLVKGVSEDGTPAFHPHVVQQNGLSVLRFLQENCKQDPGAYCEPVLFVPIQFLQLYKSAGEDVIQLFDLSVIPKNHSSNDCDDASSSLPSLLHRGRSDSLYSLGTLLYRIAHRLSLSMAPNNRARCVRFFRKCLDFLDEPDHLVVRAFAHEQFARLILNSDEDLDLTSESLPVECEVTVIDAEEESSDFVSSISESIVHEKVSSLVAEHKPYQDGQTFKDLVLEDSVKMTLEANLSASGKLIAGGDTELRDQGSFVLGSCGDESLAVCKVSPTSVQTVADPISSKLAAVHHVSQAIKSLRWMRQLQSTEPDLVDKGNRTNDTLPSSISFSVCGCGDAECIEVCDIREWLPTSKLDHKLWKLVLLLGESYLALGQAYKEDRQLHQALKVVELACSIYGSMPQHLEDTRFISSMISCSSLQKKFSERNEKTRSYSGNAKDDKSSFTYDSLTFEQYSSIYLFWARAWTLVGDVYVEFHIMYGKEISIQAERTSNIRELRISSEVVKEVKRLKKKLGQCNQSCSSCSLVNCSCQSDRASSGSSASSSKADMHSIGYGRKHTKKSYAKSTSHSLLGDPGDDHVHHQMDTRKRFDGGHLQHNRGDESLKEASSSNDTGVQTLETNTKKVEGFLEMRDIGSTVTSQMEIASRETPKVKNGGIFKFLGGPVVRDTEHNLLAALSCYEEARKALGGLPRGSEELQSVFKKKGWVCNELGRNRLERKELNEAEVAFADAINAFREVSDHPNIILINCNLAHGRRALAEVMVSKIEDLKIHTIFRNAYNQALKTAKLEYTESLRYYGAAKSELNFIAEGGDSVTSGLRNEVLTQFAHTYLRLGMLLAKEDVSAEVYENGALEDKFVGYAGTGVRKSRKELRKHEISANDAIREALSVYESLGELRKQEAAYAYFQLACYQRDCCLKFLESDHKESNMSKGESSILQRVKQYASLAERNWQRAMDFYGPQTHPTMYLKILIERSALSLSLSALLRSNAVRSWTSLFLVILICLVRGEPSIPIFPSLNSLNLWHNGFRCYSCGS
ncbi:Erythroid differentiation-related factor 1 [Morella rubra]|uniref:Erythroid differentiation-related factor 1 n=1 Tax=Morella rubra TaxID=262757 RepID=A0A6A1VHE4_9ROSI|nr:Erythroid differentiation-related factor 1 [Morella rubra]